METECASCEVLTGLQVLLQVASISQLTVSRLSRQCGILNISQPYRPPRPSECSSFQLTVIRIVSGRSSFTTQANIAWCEPCLRLMSPRTFRCSLSFPSSELRHFPVISARIYNTVRRLCLSDSSVCTHCVIILTASWPPPSLLPNFPNLIKFS
jgi:hypothetical protein